MHYEARFLAFIILITTLSLQAVSRYSPIPTSLSQLTAHNRQWPREVMANGAVSEDGPWMVAPLACHFLHTACKTYFRKQRTQERCGWVERIGE
jgi:hypothetical protein